MEIERVLQVMSDINLSSGGGGGRDCPVLSCLGKAHLRYGGQSNPLKFYLLLLLLS